ncbi:MAG TPA: hypothetical protein VLD39_17990, partial [Gammaproteobacteria bacterium]|nr:hypothetical protein [Gammaproteobacteria bacterium]
NGGAGPIDGEVWIDDIRLDGAVRDPGAAANLTLDVASDVLSASVSYANQGSVFRQLTNDASYVAAGDLSLNSRAQLGRMLPASWGMDVPISVSHISSARTPSFLDRSDVRAASLDGLRDSGAGATSIGIRISKQTPSASPWIGLVADATTLSFGYEAAHSNTITTRNESGGYRGALEYDRQIGRRDIDILPGFVEDALRAIAPAAIERSAFFQRLLSGRLRWTPQRLGFGTSYSDANAKAWRYTSILTDTSDSALKPIESPRRRLDNNAQIGFAPFSSLTANLSLRSGRDLLDPEQATQQALARQALRDARTSFAGTDIGWETSRSLTSTMSFNPDVANWIRPTYSYTNRYQTNRDPSYFEIESEDG